MENRAIDILGAYVLFLCLFQATPKHAKKPKTPQDRSLTGFFMELLSRFELLTSSLPTHWDVSK